MSYLPFHQVKFGNKSRDTNYGTDDFCLPANYIQMLTVRIILKSNQNKD